MTTISLKIPEDLAQRLTRLAAERGTSRSAVVREAIRRYAEQAPAEAESCLTLAADLIGSAEGPADLSHNKGHLAGFGR